ncbi:MAG: hypothetical protein NVS3B19_19450 [Ginsengibacter sp.]
MSDNKNKAGKADRDRIDINEDYELRDWAEKYNVSAKELRDAVNEVGPMAKDIEAFLKKR